MYRENEILHNWMVTQALIQKNKNQMATVKV